MLPSSFFLSKVGPELFKGSKYDRKIFFLFSWQFFIPKFVYCLLNLEIEYIILHDQCIRHITRFCMEKGWISSTTVNHLNRINTASAYSLIRTLNLDSLSIGELTLVSLCVRHHVRDTGEESSILRSVIALIEKKTSEISSINSQNKMTLRSNNTELGDTFIRMEYKEDPELFEYVLNKLRATLDTQQNCSMVLLLSGGIDSMTLAHIFEKIASQNLLPIDFSFLHFDWKKRLESTREASDLRHYFRNFSIPLNIIESPIDKNDPSWDDKTTQFRFQTLRDIQNNTEGIGYRPVIFITGHVIEDILENLFMNTLFNNSKGFNFMQLFGMKEFSIVRGVQMFRPLLLHSKPKENVSHISDNASNLDVRRRAIRRNIGEYDIERVRTMYSQCHEIEESIGNSVLNVNVSISELVLQNQLRLLGENVSLKTTKHIKNLVLRKKFPFTNFKIQNILCDCDEKGFLKFKKV